MDQITKLLKNAFIQISDLVKYGNQINLAEKNNLLNKSGDLVKKLDILTHNIIINEIKKSYNIVGYISEESPNIVFTNYKKNLDALTSLEELSTNKYIIAFDPLDGSNNIDSNITTGTIFGIYEYKKNKLSNIVSSGYCLYGPATILVITEENLKVNMYQLNKEKEFEFLKILDFSKIESQQVYSINESYFNLFDLDTKNIILNYKKLNYNHRYIGSMVSDCHRTLIQGGTFMYPKNENKPKGKIRLLYEALPFAFIFINANGYAVDEAKKENINLIDKYFNNDNAIDLKDIHITTPIFLSSIPLLN